MTLISPFVILKTQCSITGYIYRIIIINIQVGGADPYKTSILMQYYGDS